MGYYTNFYGEFTLDRPMDPALANYIRKFSTSRRMTLDAEKAESLPDPERIAAGLPIGVDGEYCTYYQHEICNRSGSIQPEDVIVNMNRSPAVQPGDSVACDWTISDDNTKIIWNGNEKFYSYVDWLEYVVNNFIIPFGYTVNGSVEWNGEEDGDKGILGVDDNKVYVRFAEIIYGDKQYV